MKDLTKFDGLNKRKKVPWEERRALINQEFPSTVKLDWYRAFEDIDLFGRILRDILKIEQARPGRSGPRPVLDRETAQVRLRQMMGQDFTELDFTEAVYVLSGGVSQRELAAKVGLDRNLLQRIFSGKRVPDLYTMEVFAEYFGKDPSYFLEYRMAYVLSALGEKMSSAPEMTIDLYKRLTGHYVPRG